MYVCYTSAIIFIAEQLNKIDEDIKRSLTDKLTILQSMQGRVGDRATLRRRGGVETKDTENETLNDPRDYVAIAIEQGGQHRLPLGGGPFCQCKKNKVQDSLME